MRHFVLPAAVALGACGMVAATTQGQLVTPAGGALCVMRRDSSPHPRLQ
jgi:hypothetical protein